jgi:hypothetical protein
MSLFRVVLENLAWSNVGVGNDLGLSAASKPEYGSKLKYGKQTHVTVWEPRGLPSETRGS